MRESTLVWLLMAWLGLQPLSTDLYLPALPNLGESLNASTASVQWTLSAFALGFALGQPFSGPLSDRFGRRPILLGGLTLFVSASLICTFSHSIPTLVSARFLQALGLCAVVIVARATVRDLHDHAQGARVLAAAHAKMAAIPLLAPMVGGILESLAGWRGAFAVISTLSVILYWLTWRHFPETLKSPNPQALAPKQLWASYGLIGRSPVFWAYTGLISASFAGLFAFISGSSSVLIQQQGMSPQGYGFAFSGIVCGFFLGAAVCTRGLRQWGLLGVLKIAAFFYFCGGLSMVALAYSGVVSPWALVLPQAIFLVGHGMTQPVSYSGVVAPFPTRAGTAAAFSGFLSMVIAALVGWWIGYSVDGTPRPLSATVFVAGAAALLLIWGPIRLLTRRQALGK